MLRYGERERERESLRQEIPVLDNFSTQAGLCGVAAAIRRSSPERASITPTPDDTTLLGVYRRMNDDAAPQADLEDNVERGRGPIPARY